MNDSELGDGIGALLILIVFLGPSLIHLFRTKSLKLSDYYRPSLLGFLNIWLLGLYIFLSFFWWFAYSEEETRNIFFFGCVLSVCAAGYSIQRVFSEALMLSTSEKIRCLAYIVLLTPTFPVNAGIALYVKAVHREAKQLRDAQTKWISDRKDFLEKYRAASRRLEKLRSSVKSQEIRIREFLQANPNAVLFRAPKDAREFENICANWMRLWGEIDAEVTQYSGDGGLDVVSSNFGAQVKFYANSPVGRPEIQALYGAAAGNGLEPAFFAYSNGYTNEALEWAKMTGIACFTFIFQTTRDRFEFEANTEQAAELALREEGWSYLDWQEWAELEATLRTYEQEPPRFEPPSWLRRKVATETSQSAEIEISLS